MSDSKSDDFGRGFFAVLLILYYLALLCAAIGYGCRGAGQ